MDKKIFDDIQIKPGSFLKQHVYPSSRFDLAPHALLSAGPHPHLFCPGCDRDCKDVKVSTCRQRAK